MSRLLTTDVRDIVRGWLGEEMPKTWTDEQILSYLNIALVSLSSYDILRQKLNYTFTEASDTFPLPENIAMLWQITDSNYNYILISSTKLTYLTDYSKGYSKYAIIDTYNWEAKLSEEKDIGDTVYLHATIYHPTVDFDINTQILFEDKYNALILYHTAMLCLFQTDDMYQKFFAFYEEEKTRLGLKMKIGDRVNWNREVRSGKYK